MDTNSRKSIKWKGLGELGNRMTSQGKDQLLLMRPCATRARHFWSNLTASNFIANQ